MSFKNTSPPCGQISTNHNPNFEPEKATTCEKIIPPSSWKSAENMP
ncbi:MAG: hypothetical protein ACI84C_002420 [Flavobacteriales bacterium]|jgi:hypothetical protein